jgi:DNA-binding XRE family transcriptional regulator
MMVARESFGVLVRRERIAMDIGLRQMAKKIGVSPTYLSKIERGDFDPPAEDKVMKIAEIIGRDPDELLARAGRVASDLTDIIRGRPREMALFLRVANGLTPDKIARLARLLPKTKGLNALLAPPPRPKNAKALEAERKTRAARMAQKMPRP